MQLLWNILIFNFWLPQWKKEKIKYGGRELALQVPEGEASNKRYENNGQPPLSVHCCDQKQQLVIRTQNPDIWRPGSFLPTLFSASCVQVAQGTWDHMHSYLPCGR